MTDIHTGNPAQPLEIGDIPLSQFLCFSLYSANHAMHRVYKPLLRKLGLTYPQYLVLNVLWREDRQTVGATGAWQTYTTQTSPVIWLPEGEHLLRFRSVGNEWNLNWFEVRR